MYYSIDTYAPYLLKLFADLQNLMRGVTINDYTMSLKDVIVVDITLCRFGRYLFIFVYFVTPLTFSRHI